MKALIRRFRDLSLRLKAGVIALILVAALTAISLQSFRAIARANAGLQTLSGDLIAKRAKTRALTVEAADIHTDLFRLVAWTSNGVNAAKVAELTRQLLAEANAFPDKLDDLKEQASDGAVSGIVSQIARDWRRYQSAIGDIIQIAPTDPALGTMMLGSADDDHQSAADGINRLLAFYSDRADAETARILASGVVASRALMATAALAAVAFSLALLLLIQSVVLPVRRITDVMDAHRGGEALIGPRIEDRKDEIGRMLAALQRFSTQIRSQEQALSREREFLAAALRHMSHGLIMVDEAGAVIVCNEAFCSIYGLRRDDVPLGMHIDHLVAAKVERGVWSAAEASDYLRRTREQFEAAGRSEVLVDLIDGRSIKICRRAMPTGGWVSTHEDVTERRDAEARILHLARHDALTGASNRLGLREWIEARNAVAPEPLGVLCLDLDRFKIVNDSFGHAVGDDLLMMVARRLAACVRDSDIVARLGGDEFAIVIGDPGSRQRLEEVARRLVVEIGAPYHIRGIPLSVGVSIGVAWSCEGRPDFNRLLQQADMALYQAKEGGSNGVCFFEPAIDAAAERRRRLELALRAALAGAEFELLYQPIVDAKDGAIVSFEALIRWTHRGEELSPAEFIPLAEQLSLIGPIGAWALAQACRTAADWPEPISVSVNVSALQFRQGELFKAVTSALAASGLPARRLQLEVTESVLISDPDYVIASLDDLRRLGVKVAMDDFGTGYSSLSYLHRFHFDKVKIDRSFVQEVDTNPDAAVIAHLITSLGPVLGAVMCAEGVETRSQAEKLTELGCSELQGFLFARPLRADEIEAFLATEGAKAPRAAA